MRPVTAWSASRRGKARCSASRSPRSAEDRPEAPVARGAGRGHPSGGGPTALTAESAGAGTPRRGTSRNTRGSGSWTRRPSGTGRPWGSPARARPGGPRGARGGSRSRRSRRRRPRARARPGASAGRRGSRRGCRGCAGRGPMRISDVEGVGAPVAEARGEHAAPEDVPGADHHVEVLDASDHERQERRIVVAVGVHDHDDVAARLPDAPVDRARQAPLAPAHVDAHRRIGPEDAPRRAPPCRRARRRRRPGPPDRGRPGGRPSGSRRRARRSPLARCTSAGRRRARRRGSRPGRAHRARAGPQRRESSRSAWHTAAISSERSPVPEGRLIPFAPAPSRPGTARPAGTGAARGGGRRRGGNRRRARGGPPARPPGRARTPARRARSTSSRRSRPRARPAAA